VIAQLSDVALDPITQMLGCARVVLEDEVEDVLEIAFGLAVPDDVHQPDDPALRLGQTAVEMLDLPLMQFAVGFDGLVDDGAPIAVQSRGSHTGPLYLHLLLH
jgi:hypothetical protein